MGLAPRAGSEEPAPDAGVPAAELRYGFRRGAPEYLPRGGQTVMLDQATFSASTSAATSASMPSMRISDSAQRAKMPLASQP